MDVFRSSGAGRPECAEERHGSAIDAYPQRHCRDVPNERSQLQNRENAMRVLRARLLEIKHTEREQEIAVLRGEYTKAEWGSQIRSYVLHPYQMVKDHRTDQETGNTQAVLDGELDDFMEAYLRAASAVKK